MFSTHKEHKEKQEVPPTSSSSLSASSPYSAAFLLMDAGGSVLLCECFRAALNEEQVFYCPVTHTHSVFYGV